MNITYYGHSTFCIEAGGKKIVFDPFIRPNELASGIEFKKIEADFILLSHGHEDHIADCIDLQKQCDAEIITTFEVNNWLLSKGVEKVSGMNHGGTAKREFGSVFVTNAIHSSSMPDGSYGGNPAGFIVEAEKSFYFAGDTAIMLDMKLYGELYNLDFALLPIGDVYTMGLKHAVIAAEMLNVQKVIGMHYDTFDLIKINKNEAIKMFADKGLELILPSIGESISV